MVINPWSLFKMIIDIKSKNSLNSTAKILKDGGVVVFPTDTVYGIGCALAHAPIKKLYKIKNRPLTQPTAILVGDKDLNLNLHKDILKGFYFGTITLLVPQNLLDFNVPKILCKNDKVGIRAPKHTWLQKLISIVGPIVASSANIKGESTPKNFSELSSEIINKADAVIRSEEKSSGKPSAVYDTSSKKYLRI